MLPFLVFEMFDFKLNWWLSEFVLPSKMCWCWYELLLGFLHSPRVSLVLSSVLYFGLKRTICAQLKCTRMFFTFQNRSVNDKVLFPGQIKATPVANCDFKLYIHLTWLDLHRYNWTYICSRLRVGRKLSGRLKKRRARLRRSGEKLSVFSEMLIPQPIKSQSIFNHCSFSQTPACTHSRKGTRLSVAHAPDTPTSAACPPCDQWVLLFFLCHILISNQSLLWCVLFLLLVLWHYHCCNQALCSSPSSSFIPSRIQASRSFFFWSESSGLERSSSIIQFPNLQSSLSSLRVRGELKSVCQQQRQMVWRLTGLCEVTEEMRRFSLQVYTRMSWHVIWQVHL